MELGLHGGHHSSSEHGLREQELSRMHVRSAGLWGQLRAPDCVSKAIIFLNMFKVIFNHL